MKLIRTLLLALALGASSLLVPAHGAPQPDYYPPAGELNKICPVTGKPADPNITTEYEGRTYAFADKESCAKWKSDRENSLYHKLGGQVAIDAAVERFYVKMLADDRVKHVFDDVNMNLQRRKQKRFLSAAFGGPIPWTGLDMRKAHEGLHLTEAHFQAVAENLQSTLEDLKVPKELIAQVMAIAGSVHDDVLNKPKAAKEAVAK